MGKDLVNHKPDKVEEEKDLGVNIPSSLSVSHDCVKAVSKAQQMAGSSTELYRTNPSKQLCRSTNTCTTTSRVLCSSVGTVPKEGHDI